MDKKKTIFLAVPHGMCGGVSRALSLIEKELSSAPANSVWVLHELVHNRILIGELQKRGVHFAENLEEIPDGVTLFFSAHGVSGEVEKRARARKLKIIDATCPLVRKLQLQAMELSARGETVLLFGEKSHPEVAGVLGRVTNGRIFVFHQSSAVAELPDLAGVPLTMLSQTTMNTGTVAELTAAVQRRFPQAKAGAEVCSATRERQQAVRALAGRVSHIVIVGSPHSANTNRLREIAGETGALAVLCDTAQEIPQEFFEAGSVGISAGASVPESLVEETVGCFLRHGFSPA